MAAVQSPNHPEVAPGVEMRPVDRHQRRRIGGGGITDDLAESGTFGLSFAEAIDDEKVGALVECGLGGPNEGFQNARIEAASACFGPPVVGDGCLDARAQVEHEHVAAATGARGRGALDCAC